MFWPCRAISPRTAKHCEAAGAIPVEVRTAEDLRGVDGLVLPGGESTTMLKLLDVEQLFQPLAEFGRDKADLWNLRRRDPPGEGGRESDAEIAWA